MTNIINKPHDGLIKEHLKNKEIMIDFLEGNLSEKWLSRINLSEIKLEDGHFTNTKLNQVSGDVAYSVNIKGSSGHIYFLVEGQSTYDKNMPMRMWEYNCRLMKQHCEQKKTTKLPIIYNIVLYNGKVAYKGPATLLGGFEDPELFLEILQEYYLIKLKEKKDSELVKQKKAALFQIVMKDAITRDFASLLKNIEKCILYAKLLNESDKYLSVLLYILQIDGGKAEDIFEKLSNLDPIKKQDVMTALDRIRQEGRKAGRQEGERRGVAKAIAKLSKAGIIKDAKAAKKILQD